MVIITYYSYVKIVCEYMPITVCKSKYDSNIIGGSLGRKAVLSYLGLALRDIVSS